MKKGLTVLAGLVLFVGLTAGTVFAATLCNSCKKTLIPGTTYKKVTTTWTKSEICPACGQEHTRVTTGAEKNLLVCEKCQTTYTLCDACGAM